MKLAEIFPRKYASGKDLGGKDVTLTIATVCTEKMRAYAGGAEETKYVVYFTQAEKGVVLSRTLGNQIDDAVDGQGDTDNWKGKRVTLYPQPMTVAGKQRIAIRARKANNGAGDPPETMQEE